MTVVIDGKAIHYERQGRGPTVVLLHGWGDSLRTFDELAKQLSRSFQIIRLDLPGFGESEAPEKPYDLEAFADVVAKFLQKIDEPRPHAFIGHSNGGAIAIRGVSSGVLIADRLILLASSGIRSTYKGRKKALRIAAKAAKLPTRLLPKTTQDKLKKRAYKAMGSDLFVAEHLQETFKAVVSEDVVHDSAMISCPTLLVYGDGDTATPPHHGEMFARQIEDSKLHIISDAGHFVHHDQPLQVLSLCQTFLEQK